MTPAERAKIAVDGMRVRNDELGRGPNHDEVEALLRKVLEEFSEDVLSEWLSMDDSGIAKLVDENTLLRDALTLCVQSISELRCGPGEETWVRAAKHQRQGEAVLKQISDRTAELETKGT